MQLHHPNSLAKDDANKAMLTINKCPQHRVLIADDHPIIAMALKQALAKDPRISTVETVADSFSLFTYLESNDPDLIITDFSMPNGRQADGFRMLDKLLSAYPKIRIIVLTGITGAPTLQALSNTPTHGLLTKADPLDELVFAIHQVMNNQLYRSPSVQRILSKTPSTTTSSKSLTAKEAEVLRLFVEGMSVIQIAALLRKSIKTVSNQKWAGMRKLGCESDTQLYDFYQRGGHSENIDKEL